MKTKINRLARCFTPGSYDLNLAIDDNKLVFSGKVVIKGKKVDKPSKRLTFHSNGLKIGDVSVKCLINKELVELKVNRINLQKTFNELRLHFDQLIYPGQYEVEIAFSGKITDQMEGVYPCYYKEGSQQKKLIATQFESHHARDVFPCIDEPEAKAVFNLTLETSHFKSVLSNTPVKKQKKLAKKLITNFEPSPKMSSYLLAFVIGDMEYKETTTANNVVIRTYATKDNVGFTQFALDFAAKTLDFYTDYYGISFPLPKCDLVALPDFSSGAMENWGLVTFREQALLVDPKNTSLTIKQYVASVVAHELAHQWFGNLVTMKWWNDLWLNESFASFMSYLAVDFIEPKWKVWLEFAFDEQERALVADSLESTHPIEVPIYNPSEIRTIFDSISYEKGASVIAMLQSFMGSEEFMSGINLYLKTHAYGSAETTDLWQALTEASSKNVTDFIKPWTTLKGYPVIKITRNGDKSRISQNKFYLNPKNSQSTDIWPVPVTIKKDQARRVFYKRSAFINRALIDESTIINKNRHGFYRVVYTEDQITNILSDKKSELSPIDRLSLLSDHVEAAKAGQSSTVAALKLASLLKTDQELVVWLAIANFIGNLKLVMADKDLRELIKPYVLDLVEEPLSRLGLKPKKDDSHQDLLLRPIILSLAASADHSQVLDLINKQYKSNKIEPDYRHFVYLNIARRGTKKDFEHLLKLHSQTNSSEEKLNLAIALTSFKQTQLIKKALALITTKEVKLQDAFYWFSSSLKTIEAKDLTWQWIKDNWNWITTNFSNDISFYKLPMMVARCYSDIGFVDEFIAFFSKNKLPGLDKAIDMGVESITWQSLWRQRDLDKIKAYLEKEPR